MLNYDRDCNIAEVTCDVCSEEETFDADDFQEAVDYIKGSDSAWVNVYVNGQFYHACSSQCYKKLRARDKSKK